MKLYIPFLLGVLAVPSVALADDFEASTEHLIAERLSQFQKCSGVSELLYLSAMYQVTGLAATPEDAEKLLRKYADTAGNNAFVKVLTGERRDRNLRNIAAVAYAAYREKQEPPTVMAAEYLKECMGGV